MATRTDRIYETTFIIPPTAAEADAKAVIDEVKSTFTARGAEIQEEENWGRKRLAYPIDRHAEGTYVMLQVKGSGDAVSEVERRMRLSENVIRYLTVRVDDVPGALEASEKRRTRMAKQAEERAAREAARAARESDSDDGDGDDTSSRRSSSDEEE